MKLYNITLLAVTAFALVSTIAGAEINNIVNLQDGSTVSLTGTVASVQDPRKFTIQDNTGKIDVNIESSQGVVLKQGDSVTIDGTVDKWWFISRINASRVTVNKSMAQALGDAIEGNTTISLQGATSYHINSLPEQGLVKITGRITNIANEKEFTVKDATGSIGINIKSPETAVVTQGTQVTVIGNVNSGAMGKSINAERVLVVEDSAPLAQRQ